MINILVTLDRNYILPLRIMLASIIDNSPGDLTVYMVHSDIAEPEIAELQAFVKPHGLSVIPIKLDMSVFADAPVVNRYTKAMYYRLLAHELLPDNIDKALYLDPDILIINPLNELYDTDISGHMFAAAMHISLIPVARQINRLRLNTYESEGYFNSGVLLISYAR